MLFSMVNGTKQITLKLAKVSASDTSIELEFYNGEATSFNIDFLYKQLYLLYLLHCCALYMPQVEPSFRNLSRCSSHAILRLTQHDEKENTYEKT